jgi:hypothetical protein
MMSEFNKTFRFFVLMLLLASLFSVSEARAAGSYFQIRVYHFKNNAQQQVTEGYLKDVFVPNLHKRGIKQVGVFKTLEADTVDKRIYVLIPFSTWKSIETFEDKVVALDIATPASEYVNANYKAPPYTRMETIILSAFEKMPGTAVPKLTSPKAERIYELRSYEGPTEKYYRNKVKMFNDGDEVGLFNRLGFNAVFYAKVLAGSRMPNLMYMTTFNNKQDRDKHWEAFSNDPQWKTLSALPEYQNNVSKGDIIFLHPTEYSDF